MSIYNTANEELKTFYENYILDYAKLRNYDFGIDKRENVSNLSKYISHGILNEFDIIKIIINRYPYSKIEKYIQEIFWRIYWKGWLEHRPNIWNNFIYFVNSTQLSSNYYDAVNGCTNIKCFDEWVKELRTTNYLHNHTRMWFASIWIFTLNLPWQLGAKFFLEHLLDGDAASNTLSWRWVAGLQTKGKNYVAKSWNISKFTEGIYNPENLNEDALPIEENEFFKTLELNYNLNLNKKNKNLILFDTNLNIENKNEFFKCYENIYVISLDNETRKVKLSESVLNFKKELVNCFLKSIKNSTRINIYDLDRFLKKNKKFDIIYPYVGENLDFINENLIMYNKNYEFIYRKEDTLCWKFSKKGFFNFKKHIPYIIKEII